MNRKPFSVVGTDVEADILTTLAAKAGREQRPVSKAVGEPGPRVLEFATVRARRVAVHGSGTRTSMFRCIETILVR